MPTNEMPYVVAQHLTFLTGRRRPVKAVAARKPQRCEQCKTGPQQRRVSKSRADGTYYGHLHLCLPCCGKLDAAVWTVGT